MTPSLRSLRVRWLGRVRYTDGLRLQDDLVAALRRGEIGDTLLLLEHPPVVTLGRGADPRHVLLSADELARRGIEFHACGRGGDVTYHGPGQLVGYPILALAESERDAHRYLRALEAALIETVAAFGIVARPVAGLTGIWVGPDKIGAIGVRFGTGWITSHGFALNVSTDLDAFSTIVPCGIRGRGVTSIERVTGRRPSLPEVAVAAAGAVASSLSRRLERAEELRAMLTAPAYRAAGGGAA